MAHRRLVDDGGPLLLVRAAGDASEQVGARHADLVRIAAPTAHEARVWRDRIRAAARRAGRHPDHVRVVADLTICVSSCDDHATARAELIETITAEPLGGAGARYIGTPDGLAEGMAKWLLSGSCDGFTLLPASLPIDLVLVVDLVLPQLRRQGLVPGGEPQRAGVR
jgi:alkanesulfonate monooxygenase SsuD/methylene tetrahydromethanopterin reductase-like flavin-dependent oxidoreductase (luciferase family)